MLTGFLLWLGLVTTLFLLRLATPRNVDVVQVALTPTTVIGAIASTTSPTAETPVEIGVTPTMAASGPTIIPSPTETTIVTPTPIATVVPPLFSAGLPSVSAVAPQQSPSVGPTAVPPTLQQMLEATEKVRTGELDVLVDYGGGARSSVRVRFDRGDQQGPSRLHIVNIYASAGSGATRTFEQIAIGEQTWARQMSGAWAPASTQDGMWDQLAVYLPQKAGVASPTATPTGDGIVMRYTDTVRDAETELHIGPAGMPRLFVQRARSNGIEIRVSYQRLGLPIDIRDPTVP